MIAAILLWAQLGGQPVPSPAPQPPPATPGSPLPSTSPSPAPPVAAPLPTPLSTTSPSPAPSGPVSPAPVVSPSAQPYGYIFVPPPPAPDPSPGGPRIVEIEMTDRAIHPNAEMRVHVRTNPSVVAVTAAALGRTLDLPQLAPGEFERAERIPSLPFFAFGRTVQVEFRAASTDGRVVSVTIPVLIEH